MARMRNATIVAAGLALLLGATACAEQSQQKVTAGGTATTSSVAPIDPAQAVATADLINARLDPGAVLTVNAGSPPLPEFPAGTWLNLGVAPAGDDNNDQLRNEWEADLLQGDTAQALSGGSGNLQAFIAGSTITIDNVGGAYHELAAAASGFASATTSFSGRGTSQESADITQDAQSAGFDSAVVTFLHPTSTAVEVIVTAGNLANARNTQELFDSIAGDGSVYEGIYLEVRSASGQTLAALARASRTNTGRYWVSPDLGVDTGVAHG